MYMIVAPIQIKDGYRARFIKEMLEDAKGSVDNEPGCLRFEVIQDGKDPNRIWLVEAYKDAAAFKTHQTMPHYTKWRDAVKEWRDDDCPTGAGPNSHPIWPTEAEWEDVAITCARKL